jgi:FRG domain
MPTPRDWSQRLKEFVNGWKTGGDDYLGDNPFPKFVLTEPAESWGDFLGWLGELQGLWCFRGQRNAEWFLNTSLDRARKKEYSSPNGNGYHHLDRKPISSELLFRFQQQAHQYIPDLPSGEDVSSWYAMMQHHGVPTMLLDWTKSPYVALYFAFEEDPPQEGSALWAIDLEWLEKKARQLLLTDTLGDLKGQAEYLNALLRHTANHSETPVILPVNPQRLDARMSAQQGFFLCTVHQAFFESDSHEYDDSPRNIGRP